MKDGKKIRKIIVLLRREIGRTTAVVKHSEPFQVLVSTVLSQRTRDPNTEKASRKLFARFRGVKEIARADVKEIEHLIRGTGFYKIKARRIKRIANILLENYNGKVPSKFDKLIELPGVGRKTANCVLVYAYRKPAIPVDTHVHRISNRLGLVKTKTPEKTEAALTKVVPKRYWIELNELMVKFGQRKCLPRNPRCSVCSLKSLCDYYKSAYKLKN